MAKPKISIVTPSFNSVDFIEQTIDSVLSQQYSNLEYIIVDGGSNDGTVEIIKKYGKYLTYWVSEADNGQSNAINKGCAIAKGEIINWLNADDFYENDTLQVVAEAFNDSHVSVVSGRCRVVEANGKYEKFITKGTDIYPNNLAKTIGWARIDQPSTFFRRHDRNFHFSVNESLHYIMDRELWCRYLLTLGIDGIKEVNDILVNFRHHQSSKTVKNSTSFNNERLLFYYTLAVKCNLLNEIEVFTKLYEANELTVIDLDMKNYDDHQTIKTGLHYFFLLLVNEYYNSSEHNKLLYLIKMIDQKLILNLDLRNMKKIQRRATYLPSGLIDVFRKIKSAISAY